MATLSMALGRPVANERFAIYGVGLGQEPIKLAETETLDGAFAWVQENQRAVRRQYRPTLRMGTPAYGEVFDWQQGTTIMCWRIG